MSNDVAEINYTEQKGELLGLSVTDMCREMIEHNLSAEEIKRNFKKYIPREIVKKNLSSYYIKKTIQESLEVLKKTKWDIW